jgi:F420-dependent oxidoreductase-like protein
MRVALMIEGQEDVTWEDWVALAETCEREGIEALFRSDHYVSVAGARARGALDAWATINALAARTTKLRLGTLVSPASFRHPSVLAKLATTADHVSGGRIELGLGTGWSEPEHTAYGFPFGAMKERMDVLAEQVEIIHDGHWGEDDNYGFSGEHYVLERLSARPRPVQAPHPPLILGGQAGPRAARLAARFADEYNAVMAGVDDVARVRENITAACEHAGREPIPISLMTTTILGADAADVARRTDRVGELAGQTISQADAASRYLVGTADQIVERLRAYAGVGVQRVYLQHLDHRDLATVQRIARELVPALASL